MDLADLIQHYWAYAFLASSITTVVTQKGTLREKAGRVVAVVLLVGVAFRLERELANRVFTPALKSVSYTHLRAQET